MQTNPFIERPAQEAILTQPFEIVMREKKCMIHMLTGEAGTVKTVLCGMFLDKIRESYPNLRVAKGVCGLHSEFTLPYTPFKEVLKQLLLSQEKEEEGKDKKGKVLNFALRKTLELAPDLVSSFIPGGAIISKLGESIIKEMGLLEKLQNNNLSEDRIESLDEKQILAQYTEIINLLATDEALVIVIDDFQWADKASVNMLYYLSRFLQNVPVFILIAYRSTEIALTFNRERDPLNTVVNEMKRKYGDVLITSPSEGYELAYCKN